MQLAEAVLRVTIANGPGAYENPGNYDAMSEVMWCGSLSHNGLTGLGGSKKGFVVHPMGHSLSEKFDITHGASLTALWPSWARYVYKAKPELFARYAKNVWGIDEPDTEKAALAGIDATEQYFRSLNLPVSLGELSCGVQDEAGIEDLAARKSCILSGLAFGKNVSPDDIHIEGISKVSAIDAAFAEAGGMKIKLLGRTLLQDGRRYCFVSPHLMKQSLTLASVGGVFNAVCVRGSEVGEVLFSGPGAGRYPTASAVVGDIIDIVKNPGRVQPAGWDACTDAPAAFDTFQACFYIRTQQDKERAQQALGKIAWLPDQAGFHGGITQSTTLGALRASGLDLASCWPIFE